MVNINPKDYSVVIATPTYDQQLTTTYVNSLWKTQAYLLHYGVRCGFVAYDGANVAKSRNYLAATFMLHDATHILCVDADQGWEPIDLMRLLAHDREFIGAAIRKKTDKIVWNCNWDPEIETDEAGLMPVTSLGMGFVLLKRSVLQKMIAADPEARFEDPGDNDGLYVLFENYLDRATRRYMGEDIRFSEKWTALGGKIWIDPELDISHVGRYDFHGRIGDYLLKEHANAPKG